MQAVYLDNLSGEEQASCDIIVDQLPEPVHDMQPDFAPPSDNSEVIIPELTTRDDITIDADWSHYQPAMLSQPPCKALQGRKRARSFIKKPVAGESRKEDLLTLKKKYWRSNWKS